MNTKQRNLLRSFSFDLGPKKSTATNASATSSAETASKSSVSPERRERWKRINLFSQGARVPPSRSPSLAQAESRTSTTTRQTSFDTAPSTRTSSPAPPKMADFLSRESELLGDDFGPTTSALSGGGDDIDFDRAASAFPDISLDGSGDIPTPAPIVSNPLQGGASFDSFIEPREHVQDVKVTGDDEIGRFEDQFPDIGGSTEAFSPVAPQQPTFGAPSPFAPRPQPSAFASTPILQQPLPDENEPEVIRQWRENQAAEIKARDEASQARRQETISKAERAIDQFYEEYSAKKERNIKENKQKEEEYLSSFTDKLSAGTTWSRICDYVELQNSQSKTLARTGAGTTDLTRFKEVLLRLRREGEAAPGAAGY